MSRIGRLPVEIPAGVTVTLGGNNNITVKGALGTLTRDLHPAMIIKTEGNHIIVERPDDTKENKSLHGLTRVLIRNMVEGVSKGYSKTLVVNGVGYKAVVEGNKIVLTVGFSHTVPMTMPAGISAKVDNNTEITISGIDKELVGQFAANVRDVKRPDPYHIYGIRYKDEVIVKKVGKAAGK